MGGEEDHPPSPIGIVLNCYPTFRDAVESFYALELLASEHHCGYEVEEDAHRTRTPILLLYFEFATRPMALIQLCHKVVVEVIANNWPKEYQTPQIMMAASETLFMELLHEQGRRRAEENNK